MYLTGWFTTIAFGLMIAGCTPGETTQPIDTAAIQQELTDRLVAYGEAAVARDADRAFSFFTADARVLEPGLDMSGQELHGFLQEFYKTGGVISVEFNPYKQFLHGDVAYENGAYDEVVEIAGEQQTIHGYYFLRWEKGPDGAWLIDQIVAGPREAPSGM